MGKIGLEAALFPMFVDTIFLSFEHLLMFIGGVHKNKRTATLDCLGPKQAVMPILFYVAAHLLAQLRKQCVADCLNPRQLLLYAVKLVYNRENVLQYRYGC